MQPFAHRTIVGGGRGAEADDRDAKPDVQLQNAPVPGEARPGQRVAGEGFRRFGSEGVVLAEGGFQHTELDSSAYRDNFDGIKVSAGLRSAIGNNFEGWIKANYVDGSDYDSEFSGMPLIKQYERKWEHRYRGAMYRFRTEGGSGHLRVTGLAITVRKQ